MDCTNIVIIEQLIYNVFLNNKKEIHKKNKVTSVEISLLLRIILELLYFLCFFRNLLTWGDFIYIISKLNTDRNKYV